MPIVYMEEIKTIELDFNHVTSLDCLTEMQTVPNLEMISLTRNTPKLEGYLRLVPRDPHELVCDFYRQDFKRQGRVFDVPNRHHRVHQHFYCQ